MMKDVIDVGKWIESENCFFVMGQLRRLGVLTREDQKKAMRLSRSEWIAMMKEKAGLTPENEKRKREIANEEKEEESENI